ncbi:Phenylacetic acid catabolic protein [Streptomyces canus]|uniref:Phenylacetic acid catabolic protein n=1 Tax=Streptomyces canus TaxID=58343 RepID=UPI002781453F|nr:1,2-phenylacetyl-CoA epoxidase catalytic subunit [Streptomyces canus]
MVVECGHHQLLRPDPYHRHYAAEWTVRLGDGTTESRRRVKAALDSVTPWPRELLADRTAAPLGAAPAAVAHRTWSEPAEVLRSAGLNRTQAGLHDSTLVTAIADSGRDGAHTGIPPVSTSPTSSPVNRARRTCSRDAWTPGGSSR